MKIDPVSLQLFVSIVEEGTISAAAEREHIVPSAVSRRLAELEATLQTSLLRRTNRGVEPTPAGLALLSLARGVLHDLDEIKVQMSSYSQGLRGQIRIFASMSAITLYLAQDLAAFVQAHPHVQIHLEQHLSNAVTKGVAENNADVGISISSPHGFELDSFPYRSYSLVLLVPRGHPLAGRQSVRFRETLDLPYIDFTGVNVRLVSAANELGRTLNLRLHVASYEALCAMVEVGLGIGVLPASLASYYACTRDLVAIVLDEPWARCDLNVWVRSTDALTPAAQLFLDSLRVPR
ncbi:LysR family transcriptional regulator [Caballeronia sp. dw_19]|uniref:LysR family transcriptional regulator n=1 Tax=Caballeronia sp. dw_19 TaxID=2719791 RepID=UPI001BD568FA|nr:LysR family transcriptional regulator [Caballeronia sp. dw_19]